VRWLKLFFLAVLVLSSTTASARFTASLLPRERLEEKGFSEKLSLLEKAAQVLEKSRIEAEPPTCSLSPFGELIRASGPLAQANPFRFSTKYWDQESDLVYYGFRYYSPSLGRWISRDPIDEDDGPNIYAFIRNAGVNNFDPLGMSSGTAADNEAAMAGGEGMGSGSGGQAVRQLGRIREWMDNFNDLQEIGSAIMDAADGVPDEMLIGLLQAAQETLAKKPKTTVLGNYVPDLKSVIDDKTYYESWKRLGHNLLNMGKNEPGQPKGNYSRKANIKWLSSAIRRGDSIYLGTANGAKFSAGFAMELRYLLSKGYKRKGNYMERD